AAVVVDHDVRAVAGQLDADGAPDVPRPAGDDGNLSRDVERHARESTEDLQSPAMSELKHNTYFDGNVQSVGFERNGRRATVGVIAPGEYHFNTDAPERMTVVSGQLWARFADGAWQGFPAGTAFEIAGKSGFDVKATAAA